MCKETTTKLQQSSRVAIVQTPAILHKFSVTSLRHVLLGDKPIVG